MSVKNKTTTGLGTKFQTKDVQTKPSIKFEVFEKGYNDVIMGTKSMYDLMNTNDVVMEDGAVVPAIVAAANIKNFEIIKLDKFSDLCENATTMKDIEKLEEESYKWYYENKVEYKEFVSILKEAVTAVKKHLGEGTTTQEEEEVEEEGEEVEVEVEGTIAKEKEETKKEQTKPTQTQEGNIQSNTAASNKDDKKGTETKENKGNATPPGAKGDDGSSTWSVVKGVVKLNDIKTFVDQVKDFIKEFDKDEVVRLSNYDGSFDCWPYVHVVHTVICDNSLYDFYPILVVTMSMRKKGAEVVYAKLAQITALQGIDKDGKVRGVNKTLIRCLSSLAISIVGEEFKPKEAKYGNLITNVMPIGRTSVITNNGNMKPEEQIAMAVKQQAARAAFEEGLRRGHEKAVMHWNKYKLGYVVKKTEVTNAFKRYGLME